MEPNLNQPPAWVAAYRGRRVLVTGHTGFKGGWLATWLAELGAEQFGFSLPAPSEPNLFTAARVGDLVQHTTGDICDLDAFRAVWKAARPELVFHLAAQPIVRESYCEPLGTVRANILGTAHALELARTVHQPKALLLVTSDKCYENREWVFGYRENDPLGGHDIYSMSKAAAELVTGSYRKSFFPPERLAGHGVAVASARAGNVIGGGDWAADRIVPDCIRSLSTGQPVRVRNPYAVRPWQHVLEPLSGYLELGARLLAPDIVQRAACCDAWNFGPLLANARSVRALVEEILAHWPDGRWEDASQPDAPHEASLLRLSIEKAHARLGWSPRWDFATTLRHTVDWYRAFSRGEDMRGWCREQIAAYCATPAL